MKRLAAILLLGIFSFNIVGYKLVATFLEKQVNEKLEMAFDENEYHDNQLLTIKQPINLPYYTNSRSFQRIDGEIEIAGVLYKYVKCRIYNDSLELLCIPNAGKMKIQAAKADFSKLAADLQQSSHKKKSSSDSKTVQQSISEYEEQQPGFAFDAAELSSQYFIRNNSFVNSLFTKSIEQPPDVQACNS